jgi:uncharacterized delta-60 repeat protein
MISGVAQPVLTLDPDFHPIILQDAGRLSALVVQGDGILIGGWFDAIDGVPRKRLARLNASGGIDPSFSAELPDLGTGINAMVLQPDGKLVVALGNGIIRHNPDGSTDSSFQLAWSTNFIPDAVVALGLQSDGKVIAGCSSYEPNVIKRFNSAGKVDLSFPEVWLDSQLMGFAVQTDDKIVAWGYFTNVAGVEARGLVRLNADGSVDSTFQHSLPFKTPLPGTQSNVESLTPLPEGKLLVRGNFVGGFVLRLNSDGSIDSTFTGDDPQTVRGREFAFYARLADGSLLVEDRSQIRKFGPDGTSDPSFAPTVLEVSGSVSRIVQQPDGKIVFTGEFSRVNGAWRERMARLNADGSLDSSFVPSPDVPRYVNGYNVTGVLRQQRDGKLIVGGVSATSCCSSHASSLIRLHSDGSRDESFTATFSENESIAELELQSDGNLLVSLWTGYDAAGITRLNRNGTLDASFNSHAKSNRPGRIAIQSDGNFLIFQASTSGGALTRFHSDGSVDASFAPNLGGWEVTDIVIQPDGKLVLLMGAVNAITRLNSDGTFDLSFGSLLTHMNPPLHGVNISSAQGMIPAPSGLALFGDICYAHPASLTPCLDLVLLNRNGEFDRTVAQPWSTITKGGGLRAIVALPDGGFIVAGDRINDVNSQPRFGLARLRPVPLDLQSAKINNDRSFSFSIPAGPAGLYRIETSTDLLHWSLLRAVSSTGATTEFRAAESVLDPKRFYRATLSR